MTDTHVILVAFEIENDSREQAEAELTKALQPVLTTNDGPAECWWVAEDDRHDGSDNDSAVFVYPGYQAEASTLLNGIGFTADYNVVADKPTRFEGPEPAHDAFEVGDFADHKSGTLDPRQVVRVEGDQIWLDILGTAEGPFPASNYNREPAVKP